MSTRQTMFDKIADRYDLLNTVISFGMHKSIKKAALENLNIENNQEIIDLCTGTGDITGILAEINPTLKIIGVDFSSKMLKLAKKKHPNMKFLESDCANLPLEDDSFDICTMFFGYRNVEDKERCIKEIVRVLKPSGQFVHLDFSSNNKIFSRILDLIIFVAAHLFTKNRRAYRYLIKSKQEFMKPEEVIKTFEKHGLKNTKRKDFILGVVSAQYFIKG